MNRDAKLGYKVRRVRRERGLTQARMAEALGISTSYLNLIENNQRAVTVPVLLKLARVYDVDLQSFAEDDEARIAGELAEIFRDSLLGEHEVKDADLTEIAARAPEVGRAIIDMYKSYRGAREDAQALAERLSGDGLSPGLETGAPPSEEVTEFIQERGNHFPKLEDAAEKLWRDPRLGGPDLYQGLVDHLAQVHAVDVEIVAADASPGAVRRYDPVTRRLSLSEILPTSSRNFQLAHQIGHLSCANIFDRLIAGGKLLTADSETLCRVALANYFAGAVLLPYAPFLAAAETLRYDVDLLETRFGASFEQVCHRLTALQRPGAKGVPFHLVRVDLAGNISKRFSASGMRIARFGGGCPLWAAHVAFLTPGRIRTQVSRMPDGSAYFCVARTVTKGRGGHHALPSTYAIELGCEVGFARELVYADGISLDYEGATVPVGVGCRVCERVACRQRAFPALHHRLDVDINVRGLSAYVFPDQETNAGSGRA
jgi:predicted transcriptional regulator/transcriptional regulator with XRE-family HTH domain